MQWFHLTALFAAALCGNIKDTNKFMECYGRAYQCGDFTAWNIGEVERLHECLFPNPPQKRAKKKPKF